MNTDSIQLRMHQNRIKKIKNKLQQPKQTEHKKKYARYYCDVCCKNYINSTSFKIHLKTFHGQLNLNNASSEDESTLKSKRYFFELKSTKNGIGKTDNIFTEFEDKMPVELKNDQHRCNVCNTIFSNLIDYMNHEKSHYQTLTINNSSISQKSMTLDDNMALDNADVDGTIADITNNDDKSLEFFDDSTISNTSNNDVKSLDDLDYNTSTSDTSNNDTTSDIYNYKIINNSGEDVFTSKSDFEEHQPYYINDNLRTCSNQRNLIFSRPNELNINTENNSLFNNKINIPQKNSWRPDENHIKALHEICVVQQPFECEICEETCDQYDHYQFNQWWSSDEILKCNVCNQKFSEEEELKLHEYEHVKTHFC
ncbi:probable serine/threonine-protein kinase DDB_G0283065 [Rhopalosiphum maidis]|uniref:probable serine/threonine-protein kinase DDB_G0283065 n=1 Tax=Rhopalosiphum maidis TaxID=43146 RepID=UPI000EFED783|nr:probable serine/threonine-protein kinase DDB_G0283065 [Rhopalosiphum maidis]